MNIFFNYTRDQFCHFLNEHKIPVSHAARIFKRVYRHSPDSPFEDPLLSRSARQVLKVSFSHAPLEISQIQTSGLDDTVKFAFLLTDGNMIETVLMPEKDRITLCVSSQVGCRQGCSFCLTSRMGFIRNLTTAEIINQIYTVRLWLAENPDWLVKNGYLAGDSVTNIVFMGMGEPLDNVGHVINSINIITDDNAFQIARKRVSVSTAGHVDGLLQLHKAYSKIPIAFSLLNPVSEERSRMMPINHRWPLSEVIRTLELIQKENPRFVLIEYPMIKEYNDTRDHAAALVTILKPLNARINLIPYNSIHDRDFECASSSSIQLFRDILHQGGFMVTVRKSNGTDISAACGQLIRNNAAS